MEVLDKLGNPNKEFINNLPDRRRKSEIDSEIEHALGDLQTPSSE